ncbi:GLYATL3 [Branchiostoma lanceolatum]|uniref:Glycine N-acyltransferase-like protein n=1 Tax=Branchiostoma lanceolatum TaxID=7740 RepID=A0A8K0EPF4_BRALA|nr:GLYATL3 [Branchiostoma lanceolatum]
MSGHRLSSRSLREFVNTFRTKKDLTVGPSTAKIFYTARNYLAGKIPGELVFSVDRWPDYSAVMCAAGEGTYQDIESYTFYWENEDGLLKLLRDVEMVDWGKNFTIADYFRQLLCIFFRSMFFKHSARRENTEVDDKGLPDDMTLGRLERGHADLVNSTWVWGGSPKALEFIQYVLSTFPSKCVYNKQGEPLAFTIVQPWGEYGMTRALVPGKIGVFVVKSLINELLKAGDLPYCYVEQSNEKAKKNLTAESTTKWDPSGSCFYIFYTARNYLAGKIPGELVFAVDRWPDYSAVMCAAGEGTYQFMQDRESYTFYWESEDGLLKLLRDVEMVDWGKNFTITAFSEKGLPILRQACLEMGKPVPQQENMVQLLTAFNPKPLPATDRLPADMTLGQLDRGHADLVNSTWAYGGSPKALEFIQYVLSTFPSKCVYSKQGEPLAFTILQPWGERGMTRARLPGGYGTFVVRSMINETLKAGDLPNEESEEEESDEEPTELPVN